MRRRHVIATVVVLLGVWIGSAVYRTNNARSQATAVVMSYPVAERGKLIAPGATAPDVRVPLMQLLLNPFKSKPKAYLFSGEFVLGEIAY